MIYLHYFQQFYSETALESIFMPISISSIDLKLKQNFINFEKILKFLQGGSMEKLQKFLIF